jgi:hypothetical protein
MVRGFRQVILAAFGIALLCSAKDADQHHRAEQNKGSFKQAAGDGPPYAPYKDRYSDACYGAANHDTADLCAQWRATIAAEKAADEARLATIAAIIGTVLSLATVIGLIITLWQTNGALAEARRGNRLNLLFERRSRREARRFEADQVKALEIAAENAESARRSANAAAAQVEVAKTAERAFLIVRAAEPNVDQWLRGNGVLKWDFAVANVGRTPALSVNIQADIFLPNYGQRDAYLKNGPTAAYLVTIPDFKAGHSWSFGTTLLAGENSGTFTATSGPPLRGIRDIPERSFLQQLAEMHCGTIWLKVHVEYQDAWGVPQTLDSQMTVIPPYPNQTTGWRVVEAGGTERNKRT